MLTHWELYFCLRIKMIKTIWFLLSLSLLFSNAPCSDMLNHYFNVQDSVVTAHEDSITFLKKQLELKPEDTGLQYKLAELYLQKRELKEAEKLFKKLTVVDSLAVRALTGLGRVHFYHTPHRIIPLERLKELLKIDHRSKAIKQLRKALDLDADYLPARYFLARSYMKKMDKDELKKAEKEFLHILKKDDDYRDIIYQLGHTYQKMEEFQKALDYFLKITLSMRDYARARIRMAEVYFELDQPKLSTECYYQGMETLTDKEVLDYLFDEQEILLTGEEKKEFEAADYQNKKKVFLKFWRNRDPDPSTPENERLTEHFRRVKYARSHFHFTAPPYYDDRGKIYIKYGEPDARYHSSVGTLPVKDNESWSYENVEEGLVFDFVNDGGYYRQVIDLTQAALSGYDYNQKLFLAASLYQERDHLSKTYSRLSIGFSMDRLNEFHNKRSEALDKYPGELFVPANQEKLRFPFITKWGQFKSQNKKTRLEFYTSFPGLALKLSPFNQDEPKNIDFFIEVTDSNFRSVIKDENRLIYQIKNLEKLRDHQFLFQNSYEITPGTYQVAFVITDVESKNKGIQKKNLLVRDFSGDSLMLSSLQLSAKIEPETEGVNKIFVKNGMVVNPYTFSRVMRKKPIFLYFEIYNLTLNEEGNSKYGVSYKVETLKPERNFWQKTFGSVGRLFTGTKKKFISFSNSRIGDSRDTFEYIAFDLKNLDRGETNLIVTVTDQISQQTAQSSIQLILIE